MPSTLRFLVIGGPLDQSEIIFPIGQDTDLSRMATVSVTGEDGKEHDLKITEFDKATLKGVCVW